jgi:hypothetical protein
MIESFTSARRQVAGWYRVDTGPGPCISFVFRRKPSAWHRFWVRFFLGWTWADEDV